MTAPFLAHEPASVNEKWLYHNFSWDTLVGRLGITNSALIEQLEITVATFYNWRKRNVCPRAVWRFVEQHYGPQPEIRLTVAVQQRIPFRLPEKYTPLVGEKWVPSLPPAPEPLPVVSGPPEQVPWTTVQATVTTVLEYAGGLLAERAALRQQVEALTQHIGRLERQLASQPVAEASAPSSASALVLETLQIAAGKHPVVSELERALGKDDGTLLCDTTAQARKQFADFAPPVKSAYIKALQKLVDTDDAHMVGLTHLYQHDVKALGAQYQFRASKALRVYLNRHGPRWEVVRFARRGEKLIARRER